MRPGHRESVRTSTVPFLAADTDAGQSSNGAAAYNAEQTRRASGSGRFARSEDRHGPPSDNGSTPDTKAGRSATVSGRRQPLRSWPLLVLAAPAAVAVWSGWVGIGQMTGFGEIRPLPGIWDSLHLDTAVTLPIGVEAYAAFALQVWLTGNAVVSNRTRRFARWSALAALGLGIAGQAAYHLLSQAGMNRAPWEVTTLVSCLPVLVLGMGSSLVHLLRSDAAGVSTTDIDSDDSSTAELGAQNWPEQPSAEPEGQDQWSTESSVDAAIPDRSAELTEPHSEGDIVPEIAIGRLRLHSAHDGRARSPARVRVNDALAAAAQLTASGQTISRRSLRSAGLHGSNADLGIIARRLRASPAR